MPSIARQVLKTILSLTILGFIAIQVDLSQTITLIQSLNLVYLAGVLALGVFGIFVSTQKWSLLLTQAGTPIPFGQLLRLFWIGVFFNNLLPGRTGGDLVRAYGTAKDSPNRAGAALSVGIDRGLNLAALLGIALVALLYFPGNLPQALGATLIYTALSLAGASLLVLVVTSHISIKSNSRIGHLLKEAIAAVRGLIKKPTLLLKSIALALVYQSAMIYGNYLVALTLGVNIGPGVFFYLIPVTALITLIPVTLNGFGLREGAYVVVFAQVGLAAEVSVAISLVATLCMIGLSLVGGLFYLRGPLGIQNTLKQVDPHGSYAAGKVN
tara:strand:+ start:493 stop:1470 length:978 start_codon:yes stop_codon:yes gene_type:complete